MSKLRTAVRIVLVGVLAAVFGAVAVGQPAHANIPFTFQIRNYGSGLCLRPFPFWDLPIQQQPCTGAMDQKWGFDWVTTTHALIVSREDESMCLAVKNGNSADRTSLVLEPCLITNRQLWRPTVVPWGYTLVSKISSKCVDIAGGSLQAGAYAWLYHCTDWNTAQVFSLSPA